MAKTAPKDPIKCAVWGMLVGNIETMGILPAQQGGEAIARCLGDMDGDVLERLAMIDGEDNYEVYTKGADRYVVTKKCPFREIYSEIPDWGEKSMKLVEAYNKRGDGGGALHPLCLVHKGIRKAMKANIVSLGCRSGGSGKIEIAHAAIEKIGMPASKVEELLSDKACLFVIQGED